MHAQAYGGMLDHGGSLDTDIPGDIVYCYKPNTPRAEDSRPAPKTDEEALGLLRERVPDLSSFWAPAIEYQLLRKADVPVGEATVLVREEVRSGLEVPQAGV